jgi:hypothetical protein
MKTGTVDPSVIVSLTACAVLLTALSMSPAIGKVAQFVVKTGWLYLSNTRG